MGFRGIWKSMAAMAALVSVVALSGCAAGLQPKTLNTATSLSKEIRVNAHDVAGGEIDTDEVKNAIGAALISGGGAPTSYEETFWQGSTYNTYGIRSKSTRDGIEVEYVVGPKFTTNYSGADYYQSRVVANFPVTVTKSNDNQLYNAILKFPATVNMEPPPFHPFIKGKYALGEAEVVPNLMGKFNALDDRQVYIGGRAGIAGEITVDASPDAARGNFERLLEKYPDVPNLYDYEFKGRKIPLKVTFFPYRTGCKLRYELGTALPSGPITQADVDGVIRRIESIAKD